MSTRRAPAYTTAELAEGVVLRATALRDGQRVTVFTEPASVEQQRLLCNTAPSMYDCRNLFQVNVEEGRHLWAMVYLLHKYFGRDGREEAEALLHRNSGDQDNPRILEAFNEETPDWLAFYMFTYFTDRVRDTLKLDFTRSNVFEIIDGHLSGRMVDQPWGDICDGQEKRRMLQQTCEQLGITPRQAIAMGDGANDLPMMAVAGLSVAFRAKPVVQLQASVALNVSGLDGVLNFFK